MINAFFKCLLPIFAIIPAKSKAFTKNNKQCTISQRIFSPLRYNDGENSNAPNIYFLGSINFSQIYRSQSPRIVNFLKSPFIYINKFRAYYKSLNYKFQYTGAGYMRSCKLILFPFHAFWWHFVPIRYLNDKFQPPGLISREVILSFCI